MGRRHGTQTVQYYGRPISYRGKRDSTILFMIIFLLETSIFASHFPSRFDHILRPKYIIFISGRLCFILIENSYTFQRYRAYRVPVYKEITNGEGMIAFFNFGFLCEKGCFLFSCTLNKPYASFLNFSGRHAQCIET